MGFPTNSDSRTAARRPTRYHGTIAAEPLEARRLMAAGPEFQVAPRVLPLDADAGPTGRTVVIFQGGVSEDHTLPGWGEVTFHTSEVFARIYDASGAAAGPVFRVSDQQWRGDETLGVPRPFYNLDDADVAMQDNGDFTVTWTKSMDSFDTGHAGAASTGLIMRRYTAAGVPKGPAVELPGGGSGDVAMAADGTFVVAEFMYGFSRYDATGRLISERELNEGNFFYPAVAMAPDGRFVMAWSEFPEQGNPVIRAQRFDAAGRPLSDSFVASNHPELMNYYPGVAMNRSGEFAVSWGANWDNTDGAVKPGEGAYVRRFDAAGNPRGGMFQLARPVDDNDILSRAGGAAIVLDDAGNLTAAWNQGTGWLTNGFDGDESDVYARRLGPTGQPLGDTLRVNVTTAGGHARPELAVDGAGRVTVFWDAYGMTRSDPGGTLGRRFTFEGTQVPPPPPPPATASISGACFNDADADGVRDSGEAGLAGWRMYIDADRDGVFDSGEKSTLTDSGGNYRFSGLAAGSYRVAEVRASGWRVTAPSSGWFDVTPSAGQSAAGRNFANTRAVLISGTVYNDANGSGGKNSGEAGLSGWRVWLDADNDGGFDSGERGVLTDAAGNYRFDNLPAGAHRVRAAQPSGWRRTQPSAASYALTLGSGATATGKNFGLTQKALLSGTVFHDANGDRIRQSGEAGLRGWRVFIDADRDGVFDSGERNVLTDSSGNYAFRDLPAGTHSVRAVQQGGWARTTPTAGNYVVTLSGGGSATGRLFGQRRV